MRNQRLLPGQTSAIVAEGARSFLQHEGVPVDGVLNEVDEAAGSAVQVGGTVLVRIGRDRSTGGSYVVDGDDGSVGLVGVDLAESVYVNRSPHAFALSLTEFEVAVNSDEIASGEPEDLERAAERFRARLMEIDPTALGEETGFWGTLIFDLANGDYS